ncbi:MAG: apolipoprotein N-acyltransferase [Micavibrio sp.]|nr:apolipoprotein N-acyltransferase [Micavibrio sp.]
MIYAPFKTHLESLSGFRKFFVSACLGALMTLAMPPFGLFPALFIALPAFAVLARSAATRGGSFMTGWGFGIGYFVFGLYWISAALFVDIDQWKWVLPLSLIIGPSVLALLYGFITLLAHRYRQDAVAHAIGLVAAFSGIEWLRGHMLTGFPWNLPGASWDYVLPVMQVAAFTGIYGLSLLTLFWAMLPVLLKHNKCVAHVAIVTLVVALAGGAIRLSLYPTTPVHNPAGGDMMVRIVQGNIPQDTKWNKDDDWKHFETHLKLSEAKTPFPPSFVVWPETAVSADLTQFPEIAHLMWLRIPKGTWPIVGSLRVDDSVASNPKFYNSVTLLKPDGTVDHEYNKHHLVPFGEYIPFREKLGVTPIALAVANIGDFTRGGGAETVRPKDLPPFAPLVCYEVIFPHDIIDENDRPSWIVNVTNDGWYGNSTGPYQHFASARMRAIEEGLPLARSANTGISGMIDPVGRVTARQPLQTEGYIDAALPEAIPPTLYSQYGDLIFGLMLAFFIGWAEVLRRSAPVQKTVAA